MSTSLDPRSCILVWLILTQQTPRRAVGIFPVLGRLWQKVTYSEMEGHRFLHQHVSGFPGSSASSPGGAGLAVGDAILSWRTAEIKPDSSRTDPGWVQDPVITPDRILQQTQCSACFESREILVSNYCWARENPVKIDKLVSAVSCDDGRAEGPAVRLKKAFVF